MKKPPQTAGWARRYRMALRRILARGAQGSRQTAQELGRQAANLGLEPLDVAGIHRRGLAAVLSAVRSPVTRRRMNGWARRFFGEIIVPIEQTHQAARAADGRTHRLFRALHQRALQSSAAARRLKHNVLLRHESEQSLRNSGRRQAGLRNELRRLQKQFQDLTRKSLSAQEQGRQQMSIRLHDEIAQALIAVDLRLLSLKKAAQTSTADFKNEIAFTQRLVRQSGKWMDQFAHEYGVKHDS